MFLLAHHLFSQDYHVKQLLPYSRQPFPLAKSDQLSIINM